jgi:hypothetical protein
VRRVDSLEYKKPPANQGGSAMPAFGLARLRLHEVTAATIRTLRAPVERGRSPLFKTGAEPMSHNLSVAQNHAWNLAQTLMVCVTLFRSDFGYGVMPSDDI